MKKQLVIGFLITLLLVTYCQKQNNEQKHLKLNIVLRTDTE